LAKAGASTMTELALACAMDRTSLTRTIDSLVARGLVDRSTPPSDRRTVLVEVSPSGRSLADDVMAQLGALEDQWLEIFDPATLDQLVDDLERLLARLSPPARRTASGK
jgi:DNA-binding MarR family transcriptional regulator